MSSPDDQYDDGPYREEDGYDGDQYTKDEDREGFSFYPSWGWGGGWGVPLASRKGEETDAGVGGSPSDGNGSLLDEGLITLFIVTGAILFLIPEPATSAVGILLLFAGAVAWLVDSIL